MYRKILLSLLIIWLAFQSVSELFVLVFQPNAYRSTAAPMWALLFGIFSLYTLLFSGANLLAFWQPQRWHKVADALRAKLNISSVRQRLGWGRYGVGGLLTLGMVYVLQYTVWGLVFRGVYLRAFLWLNLIYVLAFLFSDDAYWANWHGLLGAVAFTSLAFGLTSVFANILSYPFSLYWSDGNRLWDYSLIFGKHLYDYTADQPIPSLTSWGRQVLWGIPFLLPQSSIWLNRLWSAILYSMPSMILGWVLFATKKGKKRDALLLAGWAFLFLNQGPIYTPLTLAAILVALVWERPFWLAVVAVAMAGYYAEVSRFTWVLAPAVWAGMLRLNGSKLKGVRLGWRDWVVPVLLGISGLLPWLLGTILSPPPVSTVQTSVDQSNLLKSAWAIVQSQPLMWSRLLPSPTYPEGILLALMLAIAPLFFLLIVLYRRGAWTPSFGQRVAIWLPLLGFGAMGLVASTKIGGGNNLHNMDMFLITLLFVAAIAWRNGGREWFETEQRYISALQPMLLLAFVLPALPALRSLAPLQSFSQAEIRRVQIFTGTKIVESLPEEAQVRDALRAINNAVQEYAPLGEVLFIDQRQLLTFGEVPKIPLVPEYEKKVLMNEALASDADYFADYYADLAAQRFSLIISEPLKVPDAVRDAGSFEAEGDLWTKWVAAPTLCYYKPLFTLKDVYVQALVPRTDTSDCESYLIEWGVLP